MKIDNPRVRAHHLCPLCNGPKDAGLVACWPCFRSSGLKNGRRDAEWRIQDRERELAKRETSDSPDAAIDGTVFLVSVWLGQMLDAGEIDGATFNAMMHEVQAWASDARPVKPVIHNVFETAADVAYHYHGKKP
jgi:hypothetical protein